MTDHLGDNRRVWDRWADAHAGSAFYALDDFDAGDSAQQLPDDLGPVEGLRLLHLQCHIGKDSLRWAARGARVTGVDFAPAAVAQARALAARLGIDARFVCADVLRLEHGLADDERFDLALSYYGVICWLPDLRPWAAGIARYLAPGGRLYLCDGHPLAHATELVDGDPRTLRVSWSYFHRDAPYTEPGQGGSYAVADAGTKGMPLHEWCHSLGDIVGALLDAGLVIESLREFPYTFYPHFGAPPMRRDDDGWWYLQGADEAVPLMFSVTARRPPLGP